MDVLKTKLSLYYDGACHLCSREIDHYRKLNPGTLKFVDISSPVFKPGDGFPAEKKLNKYFHVQTPEGNFIDGVDAFIEIWKRLPKYGWASRLAKKPAIYFAMRTGYNVFAEIRPFLPKRKKDQCTDDHCPL